MTRADLVEMKGRKIWENHFAASTGFYTVTAVVYCGDVFIVKKKNGLRVECINLSAAEKKEANRQ